ncbi:MAG: helix-turn-helix domain containing protein [Dorea sp.]|nr:helix-turn-helix domain containing protein [Dorea sp.]
MAITDKVKSILALSGKKNIELAAYMNMTPQSLQNKLNRGSFSADDLIKIAIFTGSELSFVSGENKTVLDQSDLRVKES